LHLLIFYRCIPNKVDSEQLICPTQHRINNILAPRGYFIPQFCISNLQILSRLKHRGVILVVVCSHHEMMLLALTFFGFRYYPPRPQWHSIRIEVHKAYTYYCPDITGWTKAGSCCCFPFLIISSSSFSWLLYSCFIIYIIVFLFFFHRIIIVIIIIFIVIIIMIQTTQTTTTAITKIETF